MVETLLCLSSNTMYFDLQPTCQSLNYLLLLIRSTTCRSVLPVREYKLMWCQDSYVLYMVRYFINYEPDQEPLLIG